APTITSAERSWLARKIRTRFPGKPVLRRANPFGLSRTLSRVPSAVDRAMRTLRTKQILGHAGYRRGEIGIVRTAPDNGLFLDERLVFPVQIEPGFDRDRTVRAEDSFGHMRASEVAHL